MYGYVYLTENKVNGKKYIGQHKGNCFDENYYGSGVVLQRAIQKYGKKSFNVVILEWADSLIDLNEKELQYIRLYEAVNDDNFYNLVELSVGGERGKGWKHTEETKRKISEANKGKKRGPLSDYQKQKLHEANFGRKMSTEQKKKISVANTGRIKSLETRQKLSKALKGKKHSVEHIRKIAEINKGNKYMLGKKHSEETKQKMSEAQKGRSKTEEHKQNLSKSHKGKKLKEITKQRISATMSVLKTGVKHKIVECPHCGKSGGQANMTRYHFDNCKEAK